MSRGCSTPPQPYTAGNAAYLWPHLPVGVDVHGQGQLELAQETAGGGDGVHRAAEHGGLGVVAAQVAGEGSLGVLEGRGREDVPVLQEVNWLQFGIQLRSACVHVLDLL